MQPAQERSMKTLIAARQIDSFAPLEQKLLPEGFGPFIKTTTAARTLELLDSPPEGIPFDCILLDAGLCENGFRLLERIKEIPGSADTPVLLLVPEDNPELAAQGMPAGASDFCLFSADCTELALRLKLLRRNKHTKHDAAESTTVLQTSLDAMPSLFLRLSSTGRILEGNRAFRQATGLTKQQLQETFLLEHFHFENPDALRKNIKAVFTTGIPALGRGTHCGLFPGTVALVSCGHDPHPTEGRLYAKPTVLCQRYYQKQDHRLCAQGK